MYRRHGLKDAVGIVDGTPINFYQRPGIDGECFFTRKGRYSTNLQLICDDRGFIRYYIVGYPGPTPDNEIISKSWILKTPEKFFSLMEYLLADAGYGLCDYICTPYRHPLAAVPRNQLFNVWYSSGRVTIEHVNGRIKSRFGSLKGIRILVQKLEDFERVNKWIIVCIILYNMFIRFADVWDEEDEDEQEEEREVAEVAVTGNGLNLRQRVQADLLHWVQNDMLL